MTVGQNRGAGVQFRAEAFSVFNRPQFGLPNTLIGNAQAGVVARR